MLPLSFLTVASLVLGTIAQDVTVLRQSLASKGVSAVYSGDATYAAVTQAYNKRFTFTPMAVAFPTTVQQVSAAVSVGAAQNLRVVARSGGVRIQYNSTHQTNFNFCLTAFLYC
jgi:FAD/FMN-containing dehydrogenase